MFIAYTKYYHLCEMSCLVLLSHLYIILSQRVLSWYHMILLGNLLNKIIQCLAFDYYKNIFPSMDCALLVTYKNRTENDKVLVENHKS